VRLLFLVSALALSCECACSFTGDKRESKPDCWVGCVCLSLSLSSLPVLVFLLSSWSFYCVPVFVCLSICVSPLCLSLPLSCLSPCLSPLILVSLLSSLSLSCLSQFRTRRWMRWGVCKRCYTRRAMVYKRAVCKRCYTRPARWHVAGRSEMA